MCSDHWQRARRDLRDKGLIVFSFLAMQELTNLMDPAVPLHKQKLAPEACPVCEFAPYQDEIYAKLIDTTEDMMRSPKPPRVQF